MQEVLVLINFSTKSRNRRHVLPWLKKIYISQKNHSTALNTIISPNILLWRFCEKSQFLHSLCTNSPKLCGICTCPQNFYTRKLGNITVFYSATYLASSTHILPIFQTFYCKIEIAEKINWVFVSGVWLTPCWR